MYALAADGYKFRPLRFTDPLLTGWDVYALQTALGIPSDGIFGSQTRNAVIEFQKTMKLVVDGIAGPATIRASTLKPLRHYEGLYKTPIGLAKGILEGECGLYSGEYTKPYRNGTRDVGPAQENITPSEANLKISFDVVGSEARLCLKLRTRYDSCIGESSYVDAPEECWKYGAVLYHNWQAASNRYVNGTINSWIYTAYDSIARINKQYRMSDPAQWIKDIGVDGVSTGYQWTKHYISTKVGYVNIWTP